MRMLLKDIVWPDIQRLRKLEQSGGTVKATDHRARERARRRLRFSRGSHAIAAGKDREVWLAVVVVYGGQPRFGICIKAFQ